MIGRLQRKFVVISMFATILVTGTIFGMITAESYHIVRRQMDEIIDLIIENDGIIPEFKEKEKYQFVTRETRFSTRYFTVKLDENGDIFDTNMQNIVSVTEEDVETMVEDVLSHVQTRTNYYGNYMYRVVNQENGGKMIVFLDCSSQLKNLESATERSVMIVIGGMIVVFVVVSSLSRRVLSPIIQNIEKQKQFVTNAGHELKTPLAVILADVDVLEMTLGEENEWVNSIKNQADRLNMLIKNLLNLSNIQEGKAELEKTEFSITQLIAEQINEFRALLKEKKIVFPQEKEEIMVKANQDMMKQLIIILLDNSRKYTPDGGIIEIAIKKQKKNMIIEISNDCENVENVKLNKLFDRFYRDDESHNQAKEGYGIGLSIAQSITSMHHGKISAYITQNKRICFKIVLPEM